MGLAFLQQQKAHLNSRELSAWNDCLAPADSVELAAHSLPGLLHMEEAMFSLPSHFLFSTSFPALDCDSL